MAEKHNGYVNVIVGIIQLLCLITLLEIILEAAAVYRKKKYLAVEKPTGFQRLGYIEYLTKLEIDVIIQTTPNTINMVAEELLYVMNG